MIDIHKYSYKEVQVIAKKTTYFIKQHLDIYNTALEKIICKSDINEAFISEIKHFRSCDFNEYLNNYLKEKAENIEVKNLVLLHHDFHRFLSALLEKSKNKEEISQKEFKKLSFAHMRFLILLNEISHSLEFIKYQFDKLTSTYNRELFLDLLRKEHMKSRRSGELFSLVFFDIDYFKKVNDTHGHDAGDFILKELILLIKTHLRAYDTVARWGGEEFLILLSNSDLKESFKIISRIKDSIQEKNFFFNKKKINITCSFGISEFHKDIDESKMIANSDSLMYKAKKNGRNKIEV